ncbi:pecanex-like protein 1 isoform X2 [Chrysoperla carnea]|uniref:pecanex-like protein 1 isoform X2 n=1 Tax=Chrysoperla carnea TaxID=189513 RepID=UPI001D05DCEB|nr:pecanex-like protein 1 isoform X2 [Chrysoperla carnea]
MVSQTLEILRQGVWASLTGGWFFDPHQDVYCNTFHLYLWLFLLCFPFTIYLYCPPEEFVWYIYCFIVTVVFAVIKLINLGLHHMYDTTECIQIDTIDNRSESERRRAPQHDFQSRREDEGIELQEMSSNRRSKSPAPAGSYGSFTEGGAVGGTDIDSVESIDYPRSNGENGDFKLGMSIDLTVDVHRKNSSESSEEMSFRPALEASGTSATEATTSSQTTHKNLSEIQNKGVSVCENPGPAGDASTIQIGTISEESSKRYRPRMNCIVHPRKCRKLAHQVSVDLQDQNDVETVDLPVTRRHSNVTNCSLGCLPAVDQINIKPTGSLELGYIDKNPNAQINAEGFNYWKNHNSACMRRIRSTALETSCPPPTNLVPHPNSLEVIGAQSTSSYRNPALPPPSTTLVRNPHLSLCPYFSYGSEIVYPIAEQSDEHQTSHGPDSDIESVIHNSDSEYEDQNKFSRYTILVRLDGLESDVKVLGLNNPKIEDVRKSDKCIKERRKNHHRLNKNSAHKCSSNSYSTGALDNNKYSVYFQKQFDSEENVERTSATSKDALLENDISNSSATPEMHDARTDCNATDNENSERKLSECSFCSGSDSSLNTIDDKCDNCRTRSKRDDKLKLSDIGDCENVQKENATANSGGAIIRRGVKRRSKSKKPFTAVAASQTTSSTEEHTDSSSVVGLNSLFQISDNEHDIISESKDSRHKTDLDSSSSSTTISIDENELDKWILEHKECRKIPANFSKWVTSTTNNQPNSSNDLETSIRKLGAIPKHTRTVTHRQSLRNPEHDRKPRIVGTLVKSESERRCTFRRRYSTREDREGDILRPNTTLDWNITSGNNSKENRPLRNKQIASVEGLECLVHTKNGGGSQRKRNLSRTNSKTVSRTRRLRTNCYEASSSSSNNELSSLLPAPATPLLAAFLESRPPVGGQIPPCRKHSTDRPNSPPRNCRLKRGAAISRRSRANSHIASSHNDTSEGSRHFFRDEYGNFWTYTFDERGTGVPVYGPFAPSSTADNDWNEPTEMVSNSTLSLNSSGLTVVLDSPTAPVQGTSYTVRVVSPLPPEPVLRLPSSQGETDTDVVIATASTSQRRFRFMTSNMSVENSTDMFRQQKCYYKYKIWPRTYIRIYTDRLSLLALLDRNLSLWDTFLSVMLTTFVAIFGAILLQLHFYEDLCAFLFCFVIAGCQYSLLKSVQPDAASPTHGFNRIMAFSRPVYFCLCSGTIIILHFAISNQSDENNLRMYGFELFNKNLLIMTKDTLSTLLLCFPIIFSLGLCPQINTFTMYTLEQIDMHIFGGNAMSSLTAAFYSVFRSMITILILYGFAYGSMAEEKCAQHILFSIFCGCLIPSAYHLSRCASDPSNMWNILKTHFWPPDIHRDTTQLTAGATSKKKNDPKKDEETEDVVKKKKTNNIRRPSDSELIDPLPQKLQRTVNLRLKNDMLICSFVGLLVFGLHTTNVFSVLKTEVCDGFKIFLICVGLLLHYVIPHLRKQLPWLCIARPVLRSHEYGLFEVRTPAKVMWFEKFYVYLSFIERNILYPILFLISMTQDAFVINTKFGPYGAALILCICSLKVVRGSYSDCSYQYLILSFTILFFRFDFAATSETFLVDYFIVSILFSKFYELLLKLQFVVTYIAPWQITWGSAFHAFAQPFSVPHSAMLFIQAIISAILSTPLNPFLGSAIFLTSYVRPVKFWERDYNTRRVDHSNTRLSSHLERNLGADDNNLNSIFYEHLTRSLQHSLCGDLMLGRWGLVSQGDCFVLASDYLNCLVHIIEKGNGLVTFQMRGLEFRGTYCQQREVEAISEGVEENDGCCCCEPGHLPHMLSVNAAFSQRWLAWEVTAGKYVLEGYSIADNSAASMLQVFDFRKILITYYVKSIIFYVTLSPKLNEWLKNPNILDALNPMSEKNFVDLDPVFNINIDEDFDSRCAGITKASFCNVYHEWIEHCAGHMQETVESGRDSPLVLLCFALSLLGRRTLGAASHNTVSSVEFFLYGLHALFKGDFRITSIRDEWVFTDMELLRQVVAPAVRMSLKLHQDHFREPEEYEEPFTLYLAIYDYHENLIISHEGDPVWRNAVLSGKRSLLALRHVLDEGTDEYKIIMLNKRFLNFRVIKINRECVRGLWSGQQQELVYLRNRNPERGSIQNAKQALRNIINSSCDQPIGYPIYVSPLTTSYAETNDQLCSLVGGSLTLTVIKNTVVTLWNTLRRRCGEGCLSGGSVGRTMEEGVLHDYVFTCTLPGSLHSAPGHSTESTRAGSLGRNSLTGANRGSMISVGKPTNSKLANLAGLLSEGGSFSRKERRDDLSVSTSTGLEQSPANDSIATDHQITPHRVRILDPNLVYDAINLGRRIDVTWPDEKMRAHGGRSYWKDWLPEKGMEGTVVHRWIPNHKDPNRRSHVDRTIILIKIDDKYVPIAESGVQDLGAEV